MLGREAACQPTLLRTAFWGRGPRLQSLALHTCVQVHLASSWPWGVVVAFPQARESEHRVLVRVWGRRLPQAKARLDLSWTTGH